MSQKQTELARLFYREVQKIIDQENLTPENRAVALLRILNLLFVEVTREERIHFTTMFARIAYVGHRFNFSRQALYFIHNFRSQVREIQISGIDDTEKINSTVGLGLRVVTDTIKQLFGQPIPKHLIERLPAIHTIPDKQVAIQGFYPSARVVVLEDDPDHHQLIARDESRPGQMIRIQYNIPDRNANFNPTIHHIRNTFDFPLTLNLLDVEVDQEGVYRPQAFVVEPDYLVDVTAIAECFKDFGTEPRIHLLKKYLPFITTHYILLGHIANFFLDELMSNPEASFKEIFPKVFRLNPLAFAIFNDREIREIMQRSQKHFINLKRVIKQDLRTSGIDPANCLLEPTFYAPAYGMQGRLDVLYLAKEEEEQSAIVELKSGKAYKPNRYGISQNHFTQTLLYDLMIKYTYGKKTQPANFILYSGVDDRNLRFAPVVKAQQYEAMQLRNQLVALEKQLVDLPYEDLNTKTIFDQLDPDNLPGNTGFLGRDMQQFFKVYSTTRPIDKAYFQAFSAFIAREHWLAKTGSQGIARQNGQAGLWLNNLATKEEQYEILFQLKLKTQLSKEDEPLLRFERSTTTNPLANFRKGDIAVLYPWRKKATKTLNSQLFKCTITDINSESVEVRLRSKQFNLTIFEEEEFWNIEHDLLDGGFIGMYRSLFQFIQFPDFKKDLLLGLKPPRQLRPEPLPRAAGLTEEQQDIYQKALQAQDYFLLWGPPGTGKTSMMLRQMVAYLINETDENILLMAYTNRAVDEICEAIERIDKYARNEYLRIGSWYSTDERFRDRLLDSQLKQIKSRAELKATIENHRIIVSTVSSISGKQELLAMKQFNRVIIDEASQILEPMLVGLLPLFERFILIGDHKQLPAVVTQPDQQTAVNDPGLQSIGLKSLGDSLFERLYHRCRKEGWDWAYDQLSHQGRMHREIMSFPSQYFYDHQLNILPEGLKQSLEQQLELQLNQPADATPLELQLCQQRMLFLPTASDDSSTANKTNHHEAALVGNLVSAFHRIYEANELNLSKDSIGIITPYRAQIAHIRQLLETRGINPDELTVDTVERYQGGARDVIIISLCTNSLSQLDSLVSLSGDGVDRKLNVALTRARKHLIILGNPEILGENEVYRELMKYCQVKEVF